MLFCYACYFQSRNGSFSWFQFGLVFRWTKHPLILFFFKTHKKGATSATKLKVFWLPKSIPKAYNKTARYMVDFVFGGCSLKNQKHKILTMINTTAVTKGERVREYFFALPNDPEAILQETTALLCGFSLSFDIKQPAIWNLHTHTHSDKKRVTIFSLSIHDQSALKSFLFIHNGFVKTSNLCIRMIYICKLPAVLINLMKTWLLKCIYCQVNCKHFKCFSSKQLATATS